MRFKVGDLAITQNSRVPALNNGILVVVTDVRPEFETPLGTVDYQIRRLDGQPFPSVQSFDGERRIYERKNCWCRDPQLKKPEDQELVDEKEFQRRRPDNCDLAAFEAYERAVSSLR